MFVFAQTKIGQERNRHGEPSLLNINRLSQKLYFLRPIGGNRMSFFFLQNIFGLNPEKTAATQRNFSYTLIYTRRHATSHARTYIVSPPTGLPRPVPYHTDTRAALAAPRSPCSSSRAVLFSPSTRQPRNSLMPVAARPPYATLIYIYPCYPLPAPLNHQCAVYTT